MDVPFDFPPEREHGAQPPEWSPPPPTPLFDFGPDEDWDDDDDFFEDDCDDDDP